MAADRFPFAVDPRFRGLLVPFGVTSAERAWVEVDGARVMVRFGFLRLETPLTNVAGAEVTGPYRWYRAIGPRMSLRDRGVTFGTNTEKGTCVRFHEPVPALFPSGLLPHPALTVTVERPEELARAVSPGWDRG